MAGSRSPLSRAVGGGFEVAGIVLAAGLAVGIGDPSVAGLWAGLLLLFLGRGIRSASPRGVLDWLCIAIGLGVVSVRWGTPMVGSIQGAQGVLGLAAGPELLVAGTILAGLACLFALADWLSPLPEALEERALAALGACAVGLCISAVFLGQASREASAYAAGIGLALVSAGLAFALGRAPRGFVTALPLVLIALALIGAGFVAASL